MRLILRRVASRPDGVAGVLLLDAPLGALPLCVTLEDPWLDNATGKSCIPAALYRCRRVISPRFGATFEVLDVAGRLYILFHAGNSHWDTKGCILLGTWFDEVDGGMLICDSRIAFAAFMMLMDARSVTEFELRIEDCFGGSTAITH
jgi:hypothetical protein